ncbi:hypothetical protein RHODOSMS8_02979 [Rhodobiaceae bacterium]|nr:hypothetical protein RHODOSMS8_02979 [Rhodobiaceae bacterium]
MYIQWCLKGIPESSQFSDAEAENILSTGILSSWMRNNSGDTLADGIPSAHDALTPLALDDHVNNYSMVQNDTPYVSLSAGAVTPDPGAGGVHIRPAWRTALDFATQGGRTNGFVFRCWTIVSPKPCPGLSNISDEVRDLNLFRQFWLFHDEGEIAAKLLVPGRQIEWVIKYDENLHQTGWRERNMDFIDPANISNLVEAVA